MAFLDAPSRLVSASGSSIAFWDTDSRGRLAEEVALLPQPPHNEDVYNWDSNSVKIVLSPDGNSYAMINLATGVIQRGSVPGRIGVAPSHATLSFEGLQYDSALEIYWLDDRNLAVLCTSSPVDVPDWLQLVRIAPANSVIVTPDKSVAITFNVEPGLSVGRYELPSGKLLSMVSLESSTGSIDPLAVSNDGAIAAYQEHNYYNKDVPPKVVFIDSTTGAIVHEELLGPDDYVLMALDGRDAVVQFGTDHAELWKNLGRDGREPFGEDLVKSASAQTNPPVLSGDSMIALTTKTGTKLYARDGLAEVASLAAPVDRAAYPRLTVFGVDGQSLLTASLGPTDATARLTSVALDVATQRARACATSGRQLTGTEWTRLVGAGTTPDLVCA